MADGTVDVKTLQLKRQLGLISATSYITGSIIGTGIFISPTAVLAGSGKSVGVSLLVWTLLGAVSYCGAMCYAEYGTRLKKSGGTYTYIREAFGDLAGFVFLWCQLLVVRPLSVGLSSLATAEYVLRPLFLHCPEMIPQPSKVMLACVVLGFFAAINMYSVKIAARLQAFVTMCKVAALVIIIVGGFVHMFRGHTENFESPFQTENLTFSGLVLACYAGFYAYGGWENANMAVEEIINPHRTIPLAIFGGLAIPTATYILANVAYHAVLTNNEILSGVAVAVTFGEKVLGFAKWIVLICVALSAGGNANGIIFVSSRFNFVGGRDGLFPRFLSMINIHRRTPQPAIIILVIVSVIFINIADIKSVLGAYVFFKAGGDALGVCGIFRIRRKHPKLESTIEVHWLFPIIYIVFSLVLSTTAIVSDPKKLLVPLVITLFGVPVYFLSNSRIGKVGVIPKLNGWLTMVCHQLFRCEHASDEVL